MSRRGKEIADELAIRIMEKSGISKAHTSGQSISRQYRPLGEACAVVEKSASEIISVQKQLIAGQKRLIDSQKNVIDFSTALFERLSAAQHSGAVSQPLTHKVETFVPDEWQVQRMTENIVQRNMNGFDHNLPESNGHAPKER